MTNNFGGLWTGEKLNILGKYLDIWLKVMKNHKYKKIYIDCFAGSGEIITSSDKETIIGSAKLALESNDKFDEYYFIEKNKKHFNELEKLIDEYPNLKIKVFNGDCNEILPVILNDINWTYSRGVLFIDPYATGLSFTTLEKISSKIGLDIWYLFPFSAVNRMLTKTREIDDSWKKVLNNCFGTDKWEDDLYHTSKQLNLFDVEEYEKASIAELQNYIYNRMKSIFPYVSKNYLPLKNSKNSTLFLLFLLISNGDEKVIKIVKNVEKYILKEN